MDPYEYFPPEVRDMIWKHVGAPYWTNARQVSSDWRRNLPLDVGRTYQEVDNSERLAEAIRNNDFGTVKLLTSKGIRKYELNEALCTAFKEKSYEIIDYLVFLGANCTDYFSIGQIGDEEIINLAYDLHRSISKKKESYDEFWTGVLEGLANKGHKELLILYLDRVEMNILLITLLINAAISGEQIEIIDFLREKYNINPDFALGRASYYGKLQLVKYFISLGADNIERGLISAIVSNHIDIIDYLYTRYNINPNRGLRLSAEFDNLDSIKYFLNKGASDILGAIQISDRNIEHYKPLSARLGRKSKKEIKSLRIREYLLSLE